MHVNADDKQRHFSNCYAHGNLNTFSGSAIELAAHNILQLSRLDARPLGAYGHRSINRRVQRSFIVQDVHHEMHRERGGFREVSGV